MLVTVPVQIRSASVNSGLLFADVSGQSAQTLINKLKAGGSTDTVPTLLMPDDDACSAEPPGLATRVVGQLSVIYIHPQTAPWNLEK